MCFVFAFKRLPESSHFLSKTSGISHEGSATNLRQNAWAETHNRSLPEGLGSHCNPVEGTVDIGSRLSYCLKNLFHALDSTNDMTSRASNSETSSLSAVVISSG